MNVQNGSVVWKALADPKRRRIVQLLQAQPLTTGDLCGHFDVSRYAIMKHLKVLEEAGVVQTERRGRQRWNYLNATRLPDTPSSPALTTFPLETASVYNRESTFAQSMTRLSYTLTLAAELTAVFEGLTRGINTWWTLRQWPDSQVCLERYPGGRLYEHVSVGERQDKDDLNGLLYGIVTMWQAPRAFKVQGSLGADDVDCTIHFQLRPSKSKCHIHLTQQFWRPPTQVSLAVFQQSWVDMLEDNLVNLLI